VLHRHFPPLTPAGRIELSWTGPKKSPVGIAHSVTGSGQDHKATDRMHWWNCETPPCLTARQGLKSSSETPLDVGDV
jgi:hypothetical protein